MLGDHPSRQRNKTTERALKVVGNREGGFDQTLKMGGRQYRGGGGLHKIGG